MSMGDMNRANANDGDIVSTVESLVRRVTAVEEENRKLKESVTLMKEDSSKFVEEVRDDFSKHLTMLEILFSSNKTLEGAVLGVSDTTDTSICSTANKLHSQSEACVAAMKTRKTMDDG